MKPPNIFSEKMLKDRKYFVEDEGGSEGADPGFNLIEIK